MKTTLENNGRECHPPKGSFPGPPPGGIYRRSKNIRYKINRSKIPETVQKRPKRILPGMTMCNNCPICPFLTEEKSVRATATNLTVDISRPVNSQTKNILYYISCEKCSMQYIGESEHLLQDHFSEHKSFAMNQKVNKAAGQHFSGKGHKVSNMRVTIFEKIFNLVSSVRKESEKYFTTKRNTKYKGMNRIT